MPRERLRIVVDTNVLVSAILRAGSVPGQAVSLAQRAGTVIMCEETVAELNTVLARPGLARFISPADIAPALAAFCTTAEWIAVVSIVHACRDPDDDKFLSLALSGGADMIITGDADLLTLHPFQGVDILSPRQFVDRMTADAPEGEAAP